MNFEMTVYADRMKGLIRVEQSKYISTYSATVVLFTV